MGATDTAEESAARKDAAGKVRSTEVVGSDVPVDCGLKVSKTRKIVQKTDSAAHRCEMAEPKPKKLQSWLIYWAKDWYGKREQFELLFSVEAATENDAIDAGYEKSGKPRTAKLVAKKMPRKQSAKRN